MDPCNLSSDTRLEPLQGKITIHTYSTWYTNSRYAIDLLPLLQFRERAPNVTFDCSGTRGFDFYLVAPFICKTNAREPKDRICHDLDKLLNCGSLVIYRAELAQFEIQHLDGVWACMTRIVIKGYKRRRKLKDVTDNVLRETGVQAVWPTRIRFKCERNDTLFEKKRLASRSHSMS